MVDTGSYGDSSGVVRHKIECRKEPGFKRVRGRLIALLPIEPAVVDTCKNAGRENSEQQESILLFTRDEMRWKGESRVEVEGEGEGGGMQD